MYIIFKHADNTTQVILSLRMDRTVATIDDPPIVLGQLPAEFIEHMGAKLQPGALIRFSLLEGVS